jgi:hypothetical protein
LQDIDTIKELRLHASPMVHVNATLNQQCPDCFVYKKVHSVGYRTDKESALYTMPNMSKLPNQISSERADLLVQIAKCRRLAHQIGDREMTERLLVLAAEYEQKLPPPPQE